MQAPPWTTRKGILLQTAKFTCVPVIGEVNIAVRVTSMSESEGVCRVWDLGLTDSFNEATRFRQPRETPYELVFDPPAGMQVAVGDDFNLIGARITSIVGPQPMRLEWPTTTQHTGSIRLNTSTPAIGEIVELFAGGLNAWSCAAKYLPVSVTMRVDCKQLAVMSMQINDDSCATAYTSDSSVPVMSDVADMRTLSLLRQEEGFVASPPCQPFSGMGRGQGMDAQSAVSWDSLFKVLRFTQRRYIIVENVCGLTKHPDFQEIVQAFLWAGFICVARRVCDASTLGCAARPRVMLAFWNNADWDDAIRGRPLVPVISNLRQPVPSGEAGSVWENLPDELVRDLLVTDEELELRGRRDLLPIWLRGSPRDPIDIRKVSLTKPMPSVTAAYHRSAQLPAKHVQAKGLHVPLLPSLNLVRRLCKWEVLHSMGISMQTILPHDESAAISLIGESFPPAHAFEAILLAVTLHPARQLTQDQVDALFREGVCKLAPERLLWEQHAQVHFQGWAKLVPLGHESSESRNLARAVQNLWGQHEAGKIRFRDPQHQEVHQALPLEVSFFDKEPTCEGELCCTLSPGWPPRWYHCLCGMM